MDYNTLLEEICNQINANPAIETKWTTDQIEREWMDAFSRSLKDNFLEIDARGLSEEEFIEEVIEFLLEV